MTDRLPTTSAEILACYENARAFTRGLVDDLDDAQLLVPHLSIVNPFLWEIGHVAWFQERFVLRDAGRKPSLRDDADRLFDSVNVPHGTRWDLRLPPRRDTERFMDDVLASVAEGLCRREPSPQELETHHLCLLHEDMHGEALVYMRQTLGYPAPRCGDQAEPTQPPPAGDVELPGGEFEVGTCSRELFSFDNERCKHAVQVAPFRLARAPVTQAEFLAFVQDSGYARAELWSEAGWRWRQRSRATHPVYWRCADGMWQRRQYDRWIDLEPHLPVCCVGFHEAEAFCRWAGRRLPSESEWEYACADGVHGNKRRFPWGEAPPTSTQATLDLRVAWCAPASACAAGDADVGARQLIGNVWEWTASEFAPYPGFAPGDYAEYSAPWFTDHMVLRGGAFATRSRLAKSAYRNFFKPHRRDILAGFRTAS